MVNGMRCGFFWLYGGGCVSHLMKFMTKMKELYFILLNSTVCVEIIAGDCGVVVVGVGVILNDGLCMGGLFFGVCVFDAMDEFCE